MTSKPKRVSTTAHDASDSPSYPMGPFSTGGSSYTNAVPEEADEAQHASNTPRDAAAADDFADPNAYTHPQQEAPPVYAPPNRHPPGHVPPVGGYGGSQQHLVGGHDPPPPAYTKYTTAAQARWARSSRIAKLLCVGFLVAMVILIVAVSAGVTLSQHNGNGPAGDGSGSGSGNGNGNGFGSGPNGLDCGTYSDSGQMCDADSSCSSGFCAPIGKCC